MAKGTKYLNPADKARKEARKKELKKNKKQRQQVRSVAIEKRNPEQIIIELDELDKQEYGSNDQQQQSAAANIELLYREKRKRLKALFAKVLLYYQKEDPERFAKLTKLEADYEVRHKKAEKEYEGIKAAKEVKIDDVIVPPEPDQLEPSLASGEIADDDPLMSETIYLTPLTAGANPPGCPPGPPPNLKLLAEQLEVALSVPSSHLTNQHMPPKLPNFSKNSLQHGAPLARYKKPPQSNKRARYGNEGVQASNQRQNDKSSDTQAGLATNPIDQTKKAVIESKPVIFVPKVTKFVPASVRSKIVPKAADKNKPKQIK